MNFIQKIVQVIWFIDIIKKEKPIDHKRREYIIHGFSEGVKRTIFFLEAVLEVSTHSICYFLSSFQLSNISIENTEISVFYAYFLNL